LGARLALARNSRSTLSKAGSARAAGKDQIAHKGLQLPAQIARRTTRAHVPIRRLSPRATSAPARACQDRRTTREAPFLARNLQGALRVHQIRPAPVFGEACADEPASPCER